ncbi:MAG: DNA-processing protein DprA [Nitrososphaerales archaeon]
MEKSLFISASPQELLGRPLNEIEQKYAPHQLFIATGKMLPLPGPRVAIVGSRKASSEGIILARKVASFLARNCVLVVSGLAEGIDTAAHEAAMAEGGSTVAVLGTHLNESYPAKNDPLQKKIMRDHWAISQFPVGNPTQPKNFVIRNRTMALLSDASIIIEAGEKSGSLHQGWEALRLGRPLYMSKIITTNPSLRWPKEMMKYGALELPDLNEVLEILPSSDTLLQITS